jgi:hypothetical protein
LGNISLPLDAETRAADALAAQKKQERDRRRVVRCYRLSLSLSLSLSHTSL